MTGPAVEARGIALARPGRDGALPVVAGVDLHAGPGEVVALVGRSGCGKSTLLSVLAGLIAPDAGRVLIGGADAPDRLGTVTLMPQRDALMPWRTLAGNAAIAAEVAGVPPAEADRRARAELARQGLAGFEDHYPHAVSGGMRQRAALARTALAGSGVWLLDEPFGALDAITRIELLAHLEGLWRDARPTVILVTHDLDEALLVADRVVVLSPRPARVVDEVASPLPRPRSVAATALPAFAAAKRRLVDALSALPVGTA